MRQKEENLGPIPSSEQCRKAYRVPEGYFTQLKKEVEERILQEPIPVPEVKKEVKTSKRLTIVLRPYLYMAATFVIVIGSIRMLNLLQHDLAETQTHVDSISNVLTNKVESTLTESDFAEYYASYVEEHLADENCLETVASERQ